MVPHPLGTRLPSSSELLCAALEGGRKARNGQPTVFHPLRPRFPLSSELLCTADRVGKYELRTAGAYCPALPVMLALRSNKVL